MEPEVILVFVAQQGDMEPEVDKLGPAPVPEQQSLSNEYSISMNTISTANQIINT